MRLTLIIDDDLLNQAIELTGIHDHAALVGAALEALIARDTGKWLAALGGTQPKRWSSPQQRSKVSHERAMESVVFRDPATMSSEPTFRGTRVLVRPLFDFLEAGQSVFQRLL